MTYVRLVTRFFVKKWKNKGKLCHSRPIKVIDYEMTFNKIVTMKNKRARASKAQEEEEECAYNHDLEISDEQIEEIQVQEKGMKRK